MKRVYLDHNATTPTHPSVVKAMSHFYGDIYGNASSVHWFGRGARNALEKARREIASFLNASDPYEIIFTSGGTESDNLAIRGVARALKAKGNHIITSSIEHHAVDYTCKALEKDGYKITRVPVDKYGFIDLGALKNAITNKTILISVMYANNEMGAIEPIEEVVKIAKNKGVYIHTDAVQAAGKLPLDIQALNVDLLSFSSHKFYGPKGVGGLYVKKGTHITPIQTGGHHEKNRRAGTENLPAIVGMAEAAKLARAAMANETRRTGSLRDRLQSAIEGTIKDVKINGPAENRLYNTANISFEYLEGESIILALDMEGIAVSTGSACTSGSLEPSHVLTAMGIEPQTAQGSIRFSLGRMNTEEDIDYVLEKLPPIIERLRKMSPLYNE